MIKLKRIDAWGQFTLIVTFITLNLVAFQWDLLFISYFIVGGWQVISFTWQRRRQIAIPEVADRNAYKWFLIIAAATAPLGGIYILLFVAPFAALWYLSISFRELRIVEARHLIQLK